MKFKMIIFCLYFCLFDLFCLAQVAYKHGNEFNPLISFPVRSGKLIGSFGWIRFNSEEFKTYSVFSSFDKSAYAAANGKVVVSGYVYNEGVVIIQSDGFYTVYKGIDIFYVGKGRKVYSGQKIGGMKGNLKFEVRDLYGNAYDPSNYVQKRKNARIKVKTELFRTFSSFMQLHGFSERDIPVMYCIAHMESSFNPRAQNFNKNKTYDTGIFQINDIWLKECKLSRKDLFDVRNNARCARIVLKKQGFTAWTTYKEFYPQRCS